jgi:hypothetical protein
MPGRKTSAALDNLKTVVVILTPLTLALLLDAPLSRPRRIRAPQQSQAG